MLSRKKLGENIKNFIAEEHTDTPGFAKKVGVSVLMANLWCRGILVPNALHLEQISEAFNTSVFELVIRLDL